MKKKLLLVLFMMSTIFLLLLIGKYNGGSGDVSNLKIDANAIDYQPRDEVEPPNVETIRLPIYKTFEMTEGDTLNASLENPKDNPCYFQYTLTLTETNEEIYRSNLIKPGTAINQVKLNTNLLKGVYKLKLTISTWSLEDIETAMNGGEMITTLVVR